MSQIVLPGSESVFQKESQQLIFVSVPDRSAQDARLAALEFDDVQWNFRLPPIPAKIGVNGFGKLREGDLKSPEGIYRIRGGFGWGAVDEPLRIPWRKSAHNDYFIDDPHSPYYNQWLRTDEPIATFAASWETLYIPQYKFSIDFDFNKENVTGLGSAIFLHVWKGPHVPTAGCTAISEAAMSLIVHWLDLDKKPLIIQAESTEIFKLLQKLNLLDSDSSFKLVYEK
jgi:L,D-peptidoglycan transpeptidase YkuD (ErfK/YbiS/YcfS/YnhG family)